MLILLIYTSISFSNEVVLLDSIISQKEKWRLSYIRPKERFFYNSDCLNSTVISSFLVLVGLGCASIMDSD